MVSTKKNFKALKDLDASTESAPTQNQRREIYDVIHSDELNELYQKNSQLLSQISATGRHNNILQSELSDLIQEKSKLNIRNTDLTKEVTDLRKKMSGFNFQQEKFIAQSSRLKKELDEHPENPEKVSPSSTHPPYPKKTLRAIYENLKEKYHEQLSHLQTLQKREVVYRNQINKLEDFYLKSKNNQKTYADRIKELESSSQSFQNKEEQLKIQIKQNYQEELDSLKVICKNLRQVISQQEEGFKQVLQDFRRKQMQVHEELSNKSLEGKDREIQKLKLKADEILKQNLFLKKELKEVQAPDSKLQNQITNSQTDFRKKEQELKESHLREKQNMQNENKNYKEKLEESYNNRLRHIRAEMENDLCSEKRKGEVLKSIKDKQINDFKNQIKDLQRQLYALKSSNETFTNTYGDIERKLHDEIIRNENLKTQNKQLESLWQSLQQSVEERSQQVTSLQKLNRELSMALNQKYQPSASLEKELKSSSIISEDSSQTFVEIKKNDETEKSKDASAVIADLHFDR